MKYSLKDIYSVRKETDYWFRKFLLQPLFAFMTWVTINLTNISPNKIAIIGILFGILSGGFFFEGYMALGALFGLFRLWTDAADGAIARLKGIKNSSGIFIDNYCGMLGLLPSLIGLAYGQAVMTRDYSWVVWAVLFLFVVIIRLWQSVHVSNILNRTYEFTSGEKSKVQLKNKDFFSKIKKFLIKYKLRDPLNSKDMQIIAMIIGPLTPFVKEAMIIAIIGLSINAVFWLIYDLKMLFRDDLSLKNKDS